MVRNFVFCLFLIAPLFTWGFSLDKVSEYQKQIIEREMWNDPQWIRLGHYRKTWLGEFKSPLLGNFFLSSQGSVSPREELLKTIEVLFSSEESAKKYQCHYLARTSWLKDALKIDVQDIVACPERDAWKKQLGATELFLVFASSDLNSAGSSFGHTFLRLHNPKNIKQLELLDYGINYAAMTGPDGGALYALKGLFGFYPGNYSMLPYYQKMREYTNLEGRNLWEYRLNLSSSEVSFLIDHLLELEGSYADYYFLSDNCSQQILELIEVAKPHLDLSSQFHDATIPLDTVKTLNDHWLLSDEKLRLSLQTEWRARYAGLNLAQKKALKKIVRHQDTSSLASLDVKEKAETLEASISYLAVKEYREEKEYKNEKYALSVARARLGPQTSPVQIPQPRSPLSSPNSVAWYLGYGQFDHEDFYRFKFRRAFHDLLSDDSGLSPFSHLEILSFDFRYFSENQNLDLYEAVLLKSFSTAPVTTLDTPVSWRVEVGTMPKLMPYFNLAAGFSFDFSFLEATRISLLGVSENLNLTEVAQPHLGPEILLMTKTPGMRALVGTKYLYNTSEGRGFFENKAGVSFDVLNFELRLEGRVRDDVPEFTASVIF